MRTFVGGSGAESCGEPNWGSHLQSIYATRVQQSLPWDKRALATNKIHIWKHHYDKVKKHIGKPPPENIDSKRWRGSPFRIFTTDIPSKEIVG